MEEKEKRLGRGENIGRHVAPSYWCCPLFNERNCCDGLQKKQIVVSRIDQL